MLKTLFVVLSCVYFLFLTIPAQYLYAQDMQGQTMVIEDIDSGKHSSDSVGTVEDAYIQDESSNTDAQKTTESKPKPVKTSQPTDSQGSRKGLKIFFDTVIAIVTVLLFVVALLYFFRRKLAEALSKSSKDRKMITDILKKFNLDFDKLLPPPSSSAKPPQQ